MIDDNLLVETSSRAIVIKSLQIIF